MVMSQARKQMLLMERFWEVGIPAHPLTSVSNFYHESRKLSSIINDIRGEGHVLPDKPEGALWFSYGMPEDDGSIMTDWRTFMVRDMGSTQKDVEAYSVYRPVFSPDSFYIVLDEENWVNLPRVFRKNARVLDASRGRFNWGPDAPRVPWLKLLERGVSAVMVPGETEREHFYGYDVDSLVLLQGAAVVDWQLVRGHSSPLWQGRYDEL